MQPSANSDSQDSLELQPNLDAKNHTPIIINVALPIPVFEIFSYCVPENLMDQWPFEVGSRVCVPFGKREMVGIYLGVSTRQDILPEKLKDIKDLLDEQAVLSADILKLMHWSAA
ncbi:hypothetical protein RJJ65_34925, partial [Rhizobium hidalgonense]|nr:hypothetical protein [Rhizobium hidalgonense]